MKDLLPSTLLKASRNRNTTARLADSAYVWTYAPNVRDRTTSERDPSGGPGDFHFSMRLKIPTNEAVLYYPTLSELLKFAWMQYLSVLAIVWLLVTTMKEFIFRNQVIETRVICDQSSAALKRKEHSF